MGGCRGLSYQEEGHLRKPPKPPRGGVSPPEERALLALLRDISAANPGAAAARWERNAGQDDGEEDCGMRAVSTGSPPFPLQMGLSGELAGTSEGEVRTSIGDFTPEIREMRLRFIAASR